MSPKNTVHVTHAGNLLTDVCHEAASKAGWWEGRDLAHPHCVSNCLMLIVSELAEAMEADRKSLVCAHLPDRCGLEVELADAAIRLFDLAGACGFDLGGAIAEKMAYNEVRADHKKEAREAPGGKRY